MYNDQFIYVTFMNSISGIRTRPLPFNDFDSIEEYAKGMKYDLITSLNIPLLGCRFPCSINLNKVRRYDF